MTARIIYLIFQQKLCLKYIFTPRNWRRILHVNDFLTSEEIELALILILQAHFLLLLGTK